MEGTTTLWRSKKKKMRFNLLEKHPQHLLDDKIKDDPVVTTLKSKIGF